jgi:hypothetical protein
MLRVSSLKIVSGVPTDMAAVTKSRTSSQNSKKELKIQKNYVKVLLLPNFVEMIHL